MVELIAANWKELSMSPIIEGLLFCWKKNTDYAPKLVADLSDEQMLLQPAPSENGCGQSPSLGV